jgi:hypothetical protein
MRRSPFSGRGGHKGDEPGPRPQCGDEDVRCDLEMRGAMVRLSALSGRDSLRAKCARTGVRLARNCTQTGVRSTFVAAQKPPFWSSTRGSSEHQKCLSIRWLGVRVPSASLGDKASGEQPGAFCCAPAAWGGGVESGRGLAIPDPYRIPRRYPYEIVATRTGCPLRFSNSRNSPG